MKILLVGTDIIYAKDICWGFEELGHTVKISDPFYINYLTWMLNFEPDIIMTFGSPASYPDLELLEIIGKRNLYCNAAYVHWETDGITRKNIEMDLIELTRPDVVFTICPEMLEVLRTENIKSHLLPFGFCPITHHPTVINEEYADKITFLGNAYPEVLFNMPDHFRARTINTLIKPLLQAGERVDIWGGNWRHSNVMKGVFDCDINEEWLHDSCPYEKTAEIYSSCFINIVPQNHDLSLTKRTYEILGSGGFILTFDNKEVKRLFTHQKELAVSSSPEQTLELLAYYKSNPDAYKSVRKAALEAAQNHTYKRRAEFIINNIG